LPHSSRRCWQCLTKTHRARGKRPCAILMRIGLTGNPSRDSIRHGAADPFGQRGAWADCPRVWQATRGTMSHMATGDPCYRRGCSDSRYCALRVASGTPLDPRRRQVATPRLRA
jgi:hypothetical protein